MLLVLLASALSASACFDGQSDPQPLPLSGGSTARAGLAETMPTTSAKKTATKMLIGLNVLNSFFMFAYLYCVIGSSPFSIPTIVSGVVGSLS